MISQTQFVLQGYDQTNSNFHMYKLTFSSTSVDWSNKIVWNPNYWAIGVSEMQLSSDSSTIYSFYSYGQMRYLYYTAFSASTGSVIGTRYKSNNYVNDVYGSALNGDYLVAVTQNVALLVIYKISTSTFTITSYSENLYGWEVEPSSGR